MEETWKKWVDVANQLLNDPSAKVECPECKKGHVILRVEKIENKIEDTYLICDSCGKWNVATKFLSG